jgi:hypothetical protein
MPEGCLVLLLERKGARKGAKSQSQNRKNLFVFLSLRSAPVLKHEGPEKKL